jgi:hypothetical protein
MTRPLRLRWRSGKKMGTFEHPPACPLRVGPPNRPAPEAVALRPVRPCAGRLGAAGLSPLQGATPVARQSRFHGVPGLGEPQMSTAFVQTREARGLGSFLILGYQKSSAAQTPYPARRFIFLYPTELRQHVFGIRCSQESPANQFVCAAIGWGEPPDFWYPSMRGVAPSGCGAASPTTAARLKEFH